MKKFFYWMLAVLAMTTVSCQPKEEDFLSIVQGSGEAITASLKCGGNPEPISIIVNSGRKWFTKVSAEDNWLKVEPAAGLAGTTEVKLVVDNMIEAGARRAKIEFMLLGSSMTSEIEVVQKGGYDFIQLTDPKGNELVSPIELPVDKATIPFQVKSGRKWSLEVVEGAEWVSVTPERGLPGITNAELSVAGNYLEEGRSAKIHFQLVAGNHMTYDFEIKQKPVIVEPERPLEPADLLLDIEFASDGTAKDLSPKALPVELVKGKTHMNYYSDLYQRHAAHFTATPGTATNGGYYKVNYADAFMEKLADGHSIEVVFSTNSPLGNTNEVKMFSSHQSGGTGMMTKEGQIAFLPNVDGWKFAKSGIIPEPGRYYHAVGVWDKAHGKAIIYVDGVKKGEVTAQGELTQSTFQWFCIGADAGTPAEAAWNGDVVLARIYDPVLTDNQVKGLYEKVKVDQSALVLLSDVQYLPTCTIGVGNKYHIYGKGFKDGDKICFDPVVDGEENIDVTGQISEGKIVIAIPSNLKSGEYNLTLKRGTTNFPIGLAKFNISTSPLAPVRTNVVAHRCYQKFHKQNTLDAFIDTEKLGVWGAEIDVHITKDKKIIVDHNGGMHGNMDKENRFSNHTYEEIHEVHPELGTLDQFLEAMVDGRVPKLNMVLEIKGQVSSDLNNELVNLCADMIKTYEKRQPGLSKRIVWISFWTEVCEQVLKNIPDAVTLYLGNPPVDPQVVFNKGIKGIDYSGAKTTDAWIQKAHQLGMLVNVWTINSTVEMIDFIGRGVDLITTDHPDTLKELLKKEFVTK